MSLLSQFFPKGGGDPQSDVVPLEILAVGGGGGSGALVDACMDYFYFYPAACPGGVYCATPTCFPLVNGSPQYGSGGSCVLACGPGNCPAQFAAGAGGAGGVYYADYFATPGRTYPITVGAGGAGGVSSRGSSGGTTSFNSPNGSQLIYAIGGGGGGYPTSIHQAGSTTARDTCASGISGGSAGGSVPTCYNMQYSSSSGTWCMSTSCTAPSGSIYGTSLATFTGACNVTYSTTRPTRFGYNAGGPSRNTQFNCTCTNMLGGSAGNTLCGTTPFFVSSMTGTTVCLATGGGSVGYTCCNPTFINGCPGCTNGVTANSGNGAQGIYYTYMPQQSQYTCLAPNGWAGSPGVLVVRYPSAYAASPSFPGATDCSPATPGFRTYRFTSSGSITLP